MRITIVRTFDRSELVFRQLRPDDGGSISASVTHDAMHPEK